MPQISRPDNKTRESCFIMRIAALLQKSDGSAIYALRYFTGGLGDERRGWVPSRLVQRGT